MHLLAETLKGSYLLGGGGAVLVSVHQLQGVFPEESMLRPPPQAQESCGGPQPIPHFFMRSSACRDTSRECITEAVPI